MKVFDSSPLIAILGNLASPEQMKDGKSIWTWREFTDRVWRNHERRRKIVESEDVEEFG